jgi:hypothetical protein
MRPVITGDVNRPGQHINILALYARINDAVRCSFEITPRLELGTPLEFNDWVAAFEAGTFPVDGDVLIGFELPPCAKIDRNWIDIRRHPIRFADEFYSITSNIDAVSRAAWGYQRTIPRPRALAVKSAHILILTLQVHNDASLLRGGRFLRPWDVIVPLREWANVTQRVEIVPHPLEPVSPWFDYLLDSLPNAVVVEPGAYPAMARSWQMLTVSSSTGVEAPHFDCAAHFLWREPEHGPPVNIDNFDMWKAIARACVG